MHNTEAATPFDHFTMKFNIACTIFACVLIATSATPRPTSRPTSRPTPRPTPAPSYHSLSFGHLSCLSLHSKTSLPVNNAYTADSYRETYVTFTLSELKSDDFTLITNNASSVKDEISEHAESTALDDASISTSYGGYPTFSGSEITSLVPAQTAGTCAADGKFYIYWEAADRFETVLKSSTFEDAMETLLGEFFNNTDLVFDVDVDSIKTLSAASTWPVLSAFVVSVVVAAFSV